MFDPSWTAGFPRNKSLTDRILSGPNAGMNKGFFSTEQMDLETRLAVLDRIYRIYYDFSGGLDMACKKYCAECCTPDVTMTTIEACLIANHMIFKWPV